MVVKMDKFQTVNPATGDVLAEYTKMSQEEVMTIAQHCDVAYKKWRLKSLEERATLMKRLAVVLRKNKRKYATIITEEMGKAITSSLAEIEKCAWTAEIYAENGAHWLEEETVEADGEKHKVIFQPLGVILAVMPWNYPFWQVMRFAIPTLLAGNTALLKHASVSTGAALAIEEAFREAGFPDNVFRTVIATHDAVSALIASPIIQGVSVTGSGPAGRNIASVAGRHLKKVVLELGGSDPFIVLEDADIECAARNAVKGRFQNCGQSCIAAKRIIVREEIAEDFSKRVAELTAALVVDDPKKKETTTGSLVDERSLKEIEGQVADAVKKGATILTGGKRLYDTGAFYAPTVVTKTTKEMRVVNEEVFGPVMPILIVKSDEEAIKLANNTPFGLGGSVWTKNLERGEQLARRIEAGSVFVNFITKSDPRMPIGGVKDSGIGRELSHWGLKEFVNVKGLNIYKHTI
jgi:succinate-semialdehyde dehydrogenase / glutarate-semialdehyde dehydrogenase